jgi:predicted nucleic acid-binding protein
VAFVALLDANVLYPVWLRDALLSVAETEVFQVRWSEQILREAARNIKANRPDLDPAIIDRGFDDARQSFDDAMVTGYQALVPVMSNHSKDRHVLAAAIVGRADVIVTQNLAHFPDRALDPYGIDAQHPDEFLCNQWDLDEEAMAEAIERWRRGLSRPPLTVEQLLEKLERHTPAFCQLVRSSLLE